MESLFKNEYYNAFDQLIKYWRFCQKEYIKGKRESSGIEELDNCLKQGIITMKIYFAIRPAIENPEIEYELTIT